MVERLGLKYRSRIRLVGIGLKAVPEHYKYAVYSTCFCAYLDTTRRANKAAELPSFIYARIFAQDSR